MSAFEEDVTRNHLYFATAHKTAHFMLMVCVLETLSQAVRQRYKGESGKEVQREMDVYGKAKKNIYIYRCNIYMKKHKDEKEEEVKDHQVSEIGPERGWTLTELMRSEIVDKKIY